MTQSPNGFRPVKITNKYEQDVVCGFASSNPWIGKIDHSGLGRLGIAHEVVFK